MSLENLKKALEKRPKHVYREDSIHLADHDRLVRYVQECDQWFRDFERKFETFQQDYIVIERKQLEDEVTPLLKKIISKEGAFSRDILTHAENCLEFASESASKILDLLSEEKMKMVAEK